MDTVSQPDMLLVCWAGQGSFNVLPDDGAPQLCIERMSNTHGFNASAQSLSLATGS